MRSKRRRNRTPELIPEPTIGRMPSAIQEAQASTAEVVKARSDAKRRVIAAGMAVKEAPANDATAIGEAARTGKKPPTLTAPKAVAEEQAAIEARKVLEGDARRALAKFHHAVAAHAREAVDAQQPAIEALRDQGLQLLDQLSHVFERLDDEAGVQATLATADDYVLTGGRRRSKRLRLIGRLRFTNRRHIDAEDPRKLIPALAAAIEALGRPIEETAGERQDRERREAEARQANAYEQVRRGGVIVGP